MTLAAPDAVDRFAAELAASASATTVLQHRCSSGPIRAEVDRATAVPASAEQRARLRVGETEVVAYRRVQLMCGTTTLSAAENWYVPARLTPAMRTELTADMPFGAVIRPLQPVREILSVERLSGDPVLCVRALVMTGDGKPLAEVVENYAKAVLR